MCPRAILVNLTTTLCFSSCYPHAFIRVHHAATCAHLRRTDCLHSQSAPQSAPYKAGDRVEVRDGAESWQSAVVIRPHPGRESEPYVSLDTWSDDRTACFYDETRLVGGAPVSIPGHNAHAIPSHTTLLYCTMPGAINTTHHFTVCYYARRH